MLARFVGFYTEKALSKTRARPSYRLGTGSLEINRWVVKIYCNRVCFLRLPFGNLDFERALGVDAEAIAQLLRFDFDSAKPIAIDDLALG